MSEYGHYRWSQAIWSISVWLMFTYAVFVKDAHPAWFILALAITLTETPDFVKGKTKHAA